MGFNEEQKIGQELYFYIVTEAWRDEKFKQSLLKNPIKAIENLLGRKLSIGKEIKVYDQSDLLSDIKS